MATAVFRAESGIYSGANSTFAANVAVTGALSVSGTIATRTVVIADGTTITVNSDITDIASQVNTQAAGTLTIAAPTGSPLNGQKFMIKVKSANVQSLTFTGPYVFSSDLPQPTATTGSNKTDYMGFIYDSTATSWQLIAKNFGF